MSHVFLIGFMGAGKSTVGRRLVARLGLAFVDLDETIVHAQGRAIADIFTEQGEARFRELEHDALAAMAGKPPSIVACGGGIVTSAENRRLLRELGTVVYLRTTAAESLSRIHDVSSRPLLAGVDGEARAAALLEERTALYTQSADIEIDTVGRTPEAITDLVADALDQRRVAR